jgi:hypothetical protein
VVQRQRTFEPPSLLPCHLVLATASHTLDAHHGLVCCRHTRRPGFTAMSEAPYLENHRGVTAFLRLQSSSWGTLQPPSTRHSERRRRNRLHVRPLRFGHVLWHLWRYRGRCWVLGRSADLENACVAIGSRLDLGRVAGRRGPVIGGMEAESLGNEPARFYAHDGCLPATLTAVGDTCLPHFSVVC